MIATDKILQEYYKNNKIYSDVYYNVKQTLEIIWISRASLYNLRKKWKVSFYKRWTWWSLILWLDIVKILTPIIENDNKIANWDIKKDR